MPVPPKSGSLTVAARRFWASSAASFCAPPSALTSTGRLPSRSMKPSRTGRGARPVEPQGLAQHRPGAFGLCGVTGDQGARFECGDGGFDSIGELVGVVDDAGEVGERLEGQRATGGPARGPHHDLGVVEVGVGTLVVRRVPARGILEARGRPAGTGRCWGRARSTTRPAVRTPRRGAGSAPSCPTRSRRRSRCASAVPPGRPTPGARRCCPGRG